MPLRLLVSPWCDVRYPPTHYLPITASAQVLTFASSQFGAGTMGLRLVEVLLQALHKDILRYQGPWFVKLWVVTIVIDASTDNNCAHCHLFA